MKVPHLTPVKSSNLQSVGFSNAGLFVRFNGGTTYLYPDAPKSLYDELLVAESPGSVFRDKVRGQLVHRKLDG